MAESACSSNIRVCLLIENRLLRESLARLLRKREDLVVVSSEGKQTAFQREHQKQNTMF